ncbi:MAG: hypothetical protein AAF517_23650 [Planctomycetota bacterium]
MRGLVPLWLLVASMSLASDALWSLFERRYEFGRVSEEQIREHLFGMVESQAACL